MRVLITGFETFGGLKVNPSEQVVRRLEARRDGDLIAKVLPTEFAAATRRIRRLIQTHRPEAVLCLGVARSRSVISLERFALNIDDTSEADNAGRIRIGRPIAKDGPPAYVSTLPLARMLKAVQAAGIPAEISNHAGTYVCNHVFYAARRILELENDTAPCGFIHLPPIRTGKSRGMALDDMMRAVELSLAVIRSGPG